MKTSESGHNEHNSNDVESIFQRFWSDKGEDCSEIVALMSKKEPWALDNDLGLRLDEFAKLLCQGDLGDLNEAVEKADFVQLQAWLSSEKSLALASMIDDVNPSLIIDILNMAGSSTDISDPLRLFTERIVTFSRARLIADLFNTDRVRRIEKLARAAMK